MTVKHKYRSSSAFTIVELLVVIVVIGILAAITIVSYTGITNKANIASLSSDLTNASQQLKLFQIDNSNYPATISTDCTIDQDSATNKCIKLSSNTTYSYKASSTSHSFFCLEATKSSNTYNITQEGQLLAGPCPVLNLDASNSLSYPGAGNNKWYDLSGNGNDGTLNGGVTYSTGNGGVLSFDGGSGYVDAGNSASVNFGTGSFTIGVWIKPNGSQSMGGAIVDKYSGPGFFVSLNGLTPRIFISDGTPYIWADVGTTPVISGGWNYLVFTFNRSTNATCYINGVATGVVDISSKSGSVNTSRSLYLGHESVDNWWFNGSISYTKLYNRVLSTSDILQNFNALRGRYGL